MIKSKVIVFRGNLKLRLLYCWVGQNVYLGFSIRCYRKTQMNILAIPTYMEEGNEE